MNRRPGARNNRGRIADQSGAGANPLTIAAANGVSLTTWLRSDASIVADGILFQTAGTLGPAIGLNGSTATVVGLRVEIDSTAGGTGLGQATFRYSTDNGSTWIQSGVLTAASVFLTGTALGFELEFIAGTYNTNQVYKAVVAAQVDQTGNGHDFVHIQNDSTKTPIIETVGTYSGIPSAVFDGTDDFMVNTSIPALTQGSDVAFTVWLVCQVMSAAASNVVFSFGNSAQAGKDFHEFQYSNSGVWVHNRSDDAALLKQRTTPAASADLLKHRHQIVFTGTDILHSQDGGADFTLGTSADLNVANCVWDLFTLGARGRNAVTVPLNVRYTEMVLMLGAASAQMKSQMQDYFAARYP